MDVEKEILNIQYQLAAVMGAIYELQTEIKNLKKGE